MWRPGLSMWSVDLLTAQLRSTLSNHTCAYSTCDEEGVANAPVVDLDAVLGVGVRVFADAEIAVGVEREGRQHVGVDIDRTGVEGVEVVFGARDVAAAEDLERGGRVAQLQRGAFDAEVFDGCYFDSVVFTDAVAACGGDRDAAVVLDVDAAGARPATGRWG